MPLCARIAAVLLLSMLALPARAVFHLWQMSEIYSNADGTVQFLELAALTSGQQFVGFHTVRSTSAGVTQTFVFDRDLSGDSFDRRMLIGTQGFAALGVVQPDFIMPNGFLSRTGGTLTFGEGADVWTYGALPSPPLSLNRDGSASTNSPRNYAGQSGSIGASTPGPTQSFNVQGIWMGAESGQGGWGVNITHQGQTLFATWFTYDLDGSGLWLSSDAHLTANNTYTGQLYQSTGSPFTAYDASKFKIGPIGSATFEFTASNAGTFRYTVNGITQSKPITRYLFASPLATCTQGGMPGDMPNYDDMWWAAPNEGGWGVNVSHQGDILFATWFTYGPDGTDMWMIMSAGRKVSEGRYTGEIHRTRSAPFNAYDASRFALTLVGSGTFNFTARDEGTFTYTVDGVTQTKAISRYVFASPQTVCAFPSGGGYMDPGYPM
jgi:hypothetical protein